jgi:hypothetical protein
MRAHRHAIAYFEKAQKRAAMTTFNTTYFLPSSSYNVAHSRGPRGKAIVSYQLSHAAGFLSSKYQASGAVVQAYSGVPARAMLLSADLQRVLQGNPHPLFSIK